jgi:ABC-2 type transport system permease protein
LIIRNDFGKKLNKHQSAEVQLLINAIDAGAAGLYRAYISSVIQE